MRSLVQLYRRAFSGLPRPVWLLSGVALVNRSGTMVVPFLVLYLTKDKGFDETTAGLFLSVYGAGAAVGAFGGGALCDRIGAVRLQVSSLVGGALALFVLGRMDGPWPIGTMVFLFALVSESFRPANAALLSQVCPPELRTKAFALNRLAINLGMAIGPAVGGLLAVWSYDWLFIADGTTCLLAAVWLGTSIRGTGQPRATGDAAQADRGPGPWRDSFYVTYLVMLAMTGFVFMQMHGAGPLYLEEGYGFREDVIGLLFAINPILIVALEMLIVERLSRPNPLRIIALGAALVGIGFGLLPFGRGFLYAVFCTVVFTAGEMLEAPFSGGFVANRATDQNRGRYMGLYTLMYSLCFVVAPATGTFVYEAAGPRTLWLSCAALGLLSALGCWILARRWDAAQGAESSARARTS